MALFPLPCPLCRLSAWRMASMQAGGFGNKLIICNCFLRYAHCSGRWCTGRTWRLPRRRRLECLSSQSCALALAFICACVSSCHSCALSYSNLICSTLLLFELVFLLLTAAALLFSEVASAIRICVQLIESAFTRMLPLVPMVAY